MKKINLKGVNAQSVTGVVLLIVALINAVLQMFGYNYSEMEGFIKPESH